MNKATLSKEGSFSVFRSGKTICRFKAPYSLEKYTEIKKWDNGYIVVMAKYAHNSEPEEEYIDLIPILRSLYIDVDKFLKNIEEVKLADEQ